MKVASRTVFFFSKIDTALQGCKLLDEPSLNMPGKIAQFLKFRIVDNPDAKEWKLEGTEAPARVMPVGPCREDSRFPKGTNLCAPELRAGKDMGLSGNRA